MSIGYFRCAFSLNMSAPNIGDGSTLTLLSVLSTFSFSLTVGGRSIAPTHDWSPCATSSISDAINASSAPSIGNKSFKWLPMTFDLVGSDDNFSNSSLFVTVTNSKVPSPFVCIFSIVVLLPKLPLAVSISMYSKYLTPSTLYSN